MQVHTYFTVPLVLFGWIPAVVLIFACVTPVRAVVASFLAAWMFLPMAGYDLPGVPPYDKMSATCAGVLLAAIMFDSGRFGRYRPSWLDLPMLGWCLMPIPSSLSAGYGWYEGLAGSFEQVVAWGIPYFIGRIYFDSLPALRELAVGFMVGGLVYMPLCLFEIRMSPQLHRLLYGFHQNDWVQVIRGGGWRPTVFMQHGLAVGTFMCTATLVAYWLWRSKSLRTVMGTPMWVLVGALGLTAVLCKSTGSTVLMLMGIGALEAIRATRLSLIAYGVFAAPVAYVVLRTFGDWTGQELVDLAKLISPDRAASLALRLHSETELWRAVQPNMVLGSKRFVYIGAGGTDETYGVIPDGLWIIALGCYGLVGLSLLLSALLLPPVWFTYRSRVKNWTQPLVARGAALAIVLGLYVIDCLFNAMLNPLFLLGGGGLVSQCIRARRPAPAARRLGAPASPQAA